MRWLAVLLLASCATEEDPGDGWVPLSATDEGTVCIEAPGNAMANVVVDAEVCLSSSCSRVVDSACVAQLDGSTITVTSSFSWEEQTNEDLPCTDDCGLLAASCGVGPLPDGIYTIVHGSDSFDIVVPTVDACPVL